MKRNVTRKKSDKTSNRWARYIHEILSILIVGLALFLLLALWTYNPDDPAWSTTGLDNSVSNGGGLIGAWLADINLYLFGYIGYLLPFILLYGSWLIHLKKTPGEYEGLYWIVKLIGLIFLTIGCTGLATIYAGNGYPYVPFTSGGIVGEVFSLRLESVLNVMGTTLVFVMSTLVGLTLFAGLSWIALLEKLGELILRCGHWILESIKSWYAHQRERRAQAAVLAAAKRNKAAQSAPAVKPVAVATPEVEQQATAWQAPAAEQEVPKTVVKEKKKADKKSMPNLTANPVASGPAPSFELLDPADPGAKISYTEEQLALMANRAEEALQDFGITVKVVGVYPGPVITRLELELAPGLKVSKITGLAKDIARSLSVTSVRVVEVIPGKSVIGLEIPNAQRELVRLSEVLTSKQYADSKSMLTLALGYDISGNPYVADLAKMPHLLVAGTTGSGKSVGVNGMLLSLLYKATANDVRLILIDPKMLELSVYNGIPHLLTPVVTDMKEAAGALRWCVFEMERRYKLMAALGVRNLAACNAKIKAEKDGLDDPLWQPNVEAGDTEAPKLEPLPQIVVVVDEFADMMLSVGKKVEELIVRLAQKARASGIHLILATQRPSVDVITGLIKANVPTRISFQVSSKIDSRTVLDQMGAEQLLGHGDMLYMPAGAGVPIRVHGAFVEDHEVHKVVRQLKKQGEPVYIDEIKSDGIEQAGTNIGLPGEAEDGEADPLYDQAVQIVLESRRASISSIQRRLKIGYNRAARLVEQMEAAGLVSAMGNNGTREVLVPPSGEQ